MSDKSRGDNPAEGESPTTSDSTELGGKSSSAEDDLRNKPEAELSNFEKQMLQTEKEMREKKPEKKGLAAGVPIREKRETTIEEKTPIIRLKHGGTYLVAAIFVVLVLMVAAVALDSDADPAGDGVGEVGIDSPETIIDDTAESDTEDNTTTDEETEE